MNVADLDKHLLVQVRTRIINNILTVFSVIILFLLPLSLLRILVTGFKGIYVVQVVFALTVWSITILKNRIHLNIRVAAMMLIFYFLGLTGLITYGIFGFGLFFFFITGIFSIIFFSPRISFIIFTFLVVNITAVAALTTMYRISYDFDLEEYVYAPSSWITAVAVVPAFLLLIITGLNQYFRAYKEIIGTFKKTLDELEASEKKYSELFSNMTNGFAINEIVLDEDGRPVDFKVIEVNPAYERLTGLRKEDVIGKRITQAIPDIEKEYIESAAEVALSGTSKSLQQYFHSFDKHFSISLFSPGRGYFASVFKDISDMKQFEGELKKSLQEKDVLLRELHHRTKNNMQVINALLDIQASYISHDTDVHAIFRDIKNRIQSMALVHKKLYEEGDLSKIDMKNYIGDLVGYIAESFDIQSDRITFTLPAEECLVMIDTAIPCGLIINELVTNSLKYAFPGNREGNIKVDCKRVPGEGILLCVSDDGTGVEEGFDIEESGKMGLQNVLHIGKYQLGGRVSFRNGTGFTCEILFPDNTYTPRV